MMCLTRQEAEGRERVGDVCSPTSYSESNAAFLAALSALRALASSRMACMAVAVAASASPPNFSPVSMSSNSPKSSLSKPAPASASSLARPASQSPAGERDVRFCDLSCQQDLGFEAGPPELSTMMPYLTMLLANYSTDFLV